MLLTFLNFKEFFLEKNVIMINNNQYFILFRKSLNWPQILSLSYDEKLRKNYYRAECCLLISYRSAYFGALTISYQDFNKIF